MPPVPHPSPAADVAAVLLAAGKGTRMQSDLPKVVHPVMDRPMISWVVEACRDAGVSRIVVVVGYEAATVRDALADEVSAGEDGRGPAIAFAEQTQQLGTGDAARAAVPALEGFPADGTVLIMCGDGPLITAQTLRTILEQHHASGAAATLATAELDDPTGYGRVLRGEDGNFQAIVEQKDATPEQLAVREVNPSYYAFRAGPLFEQLSHLTNDNAQGEYYLTDVPGMLREAGETVGVVNAVPADQILGVNTLNDLAHVDGVLRARHGGGAPEGSGA